METTESATPVDGIVIWRRAGVTLEQAAEAIKKLGEAAAKVPFPDAAELRYVLLRAWERDCGIFRFFHVEWWRVFLDR
jgi:hypothetical protein